MTENRSVGGSIPPLGTMLRLSGYAWRSQPKLGGRSVSGEAERSESEDGLRFLINLSA